MGIRWQTTLSKTEFYTICESQCYSPSLKDAHVAWSEDPQLISQFSIRLSAFFFPANRVYPAKFTDKCMENEKN